MLTSLKFSQWNIYDQINDDLFNSKVSNIHTGRLEFLCLEGFNCGEPTTNGDDGDGLIVKTNHSIVPTTQKSNT